MSSYGNNAYSNADPYAQWNTYSYNQQVNSTGYAYNSNGASNAASSNYSQYGQHPLNSQYSYGLTGNPIGVNEYYSQYGYGAAGGASAAQTNSGFFSGPLVLILSVFV